MKREEFYKDEKRRLSRELDFGVWWYEDKRWPTYRVTWIEATGEVYTASSTEDYQVIGHVESETEVEALFRGWSEVCGTLNSLNWIKEKL